MKRRDINYTINSHTKQGGCKEISFLEKVNSEEEPRYKNKIMNKTRIGADENTYLLFIKSRPKKSRDIKYIIKSYKQRGLSNKYFCWEKSRPKKSRDINYINKSHSKQGGCK